MPGSALAHFVASAGVAQSFDFTLVFDQFDGSFERYHTDISLID